MSWLAGWIRVGLTDLRGDLRRFGVLIACLALGTSVIAAVGSVGASLKLAVERDATALMGGDLEAIRSDRAATADELAALEALGAVSHVVDTYARAVAGDNSAFIDLVAVDEAYPLLGAIESPDIAPGEKPAAMLGETDGVYGALIDAVLYDRLGIGIGGRFSIGQTQFEVRGSLTSLPDGAVRGFKVGLTALIAVATLEQMTDLRPPLPGLLTRHRYKVVLDEPDYDAAAAALAPALEEGWLVRSPRDAAGNLVRYYEQFSRFLLIVGLSSLLVGGVGVYNGVSAYIGERQHSIATLRSLGATSARIMVHFLSQIGVLTGIGVSIGVLAGAAATVVLLPLVGQALNVALPAQIIPEPLLTAAGFGVIVSFIFSYLPLLQAQEVKPAILLRSMSAVSPKPSWRSMLRPAVLVPMAVAAAAIFGLAVLTTNDLELVSYYAAGAIPAFLLLRALGWLLQVVLRRLPAAPLTDLRQAVRKIYRPGSNAPEVMVSIGLGLTVLLVIVLLQSNLRAQLLGAVIRDAPTFVATDLFFDEVETLEGIAAEEDDLARFDWSPMLRGAVVGVNGVDPEALGEVPEEASFLLSGEIPVTWLRDMPADSEVVDGEWWPADYDGPPLISLRYSMRDELGLKIGDTLQFRLFGETFDATIANFRDYQWQNGTNFMVTFSPGRIENYPSTFLGTFRSPPGREKDLERVLSRAFPQVSFIPIGDVLNQVASVLGQLGTAVTIVGAIAVINGLLVLAGTMAAGRKQREADAVVEKVLGATRAKVLWVFALEYGLLGALAAIVASAMGVGFAAAITVNAMELDFTPDPVLIGLVIVGAVLLTVAAGAITTWRVLSTRPAQFLRGAT